MKGGCDLDCGKFYGANTQVMCRLLVIMHGYGFYTLYNICYVIRMHSRVHVAAICKQMWLIFSVLSFLSTRGHWTRKPSPKVISTLQWHVFLLTGISRRGAWCMLLRVWAFALILLFCLVELIEPYDEMSDWFKVRMLQKELWKIHCKFGKLALVLQKSVQSDLALLLLRNWRWFSYPISGAISTQSKKKHRSSFLSKLMIDGTCTTKNFSEECLSPFMFRMWLGMFDPSDTQPFEHFTPDVVNTKEHQAS